MPDLFGIFCLTAGLALAGAAGAAPVPAPAVSLQETVLPSPVVNPAAGGVDLRGTTPLPDGAEVRMRVTTSQGGSYHASVPVRGGRFSCRFPDGFPGAPPLRPMLLYVDAGRAEDFGITEAATRHAEALLIVAGPGPAGLPDLPQAFSDDLTDAAGRKDAASAQWPQIRTLTNLYLRSRSAALAGPGRPGFDLATPEGFRFYRDDLALYDFEHRDRDWATPLGHRVAAGFWQAAWNRWFNPSNNHPWDGDPANRAADNFRPYTFTNDHADLLILHQMRRLLPNPYHDHRDGLCHEALANLLAMQHQSPDNFALPESSGKPERYRAGAFRYGMFETGEWLTEGTGWFADPAHSDHRRGGVFLGRSVWALGESLKAEPSGPLAGRIRGAIALAVRFALAEGPALGYALRTGNGHVLWRDAGEHGYLLLGLIAAASVSPEFTLSGEAGQPAGRLDLLCTRCLDALVDQVRKDAGWTPYPDQDAMAIAALADGVRAFPRHASAPRWLAVAKAAADTWLALRAADGERRESTPHFGFRQQGKMTHFMGNDRRVRFTFYVSGHWLHALAKLHRVAPESRYQDRSEALLAYFCGANPFHVRLLNELGAVPNFVTDTDADGREDRLTHDLYPESSAFLQIGLLHFLAR